MTLRSISTLTALAAVVCAPSSGRDYPSENWTGKYATRVVQSSTTCTDAEHPPPMTGFILELIHHTTNRTTVKMNPIIELEGVFEGDRMEAALEIEEPVSLPDSIRVRATAADSVDVIRYTLSADFAEGAFEGTYVVRSPDLRSLVNDGGGGRCDFRYRMSGKRFLGLTTGSE